MRTHLIDLAVALAVLGLTLAGDLPDADHPWFWPAAVAVMFLAVLLRRRFPLPAMLVSVGVALATPPLWGTSVTLYTVASLRGLRWPTAVAVLAETGLVVSFSRPSRLPDWKTFGLALVMEVVVPVLAGLWMHQRAALLAALRERAEQAERERDLLGERAVTAERRRIAREMHDVVAHRVSIVALQAGALSVRAKDDETAQLAEVIRESGSAALDELRGILKVLRDDGPEPRSLPDPTLGGVRQLADDLAAAGARVRASLPEPMPDVPDPIGRAAYRIVQEALTNAAKHAPGTAIEVRLSASDDDLVVEVANPLADSSGLPGAGYGVIGMRERVTLTGGTLRAGPDGAGSYRVRAAFPLRAEESC
ncbi:sensor histidine kinase [Amycolatopsis rubida]|uniref:histidine kinase n=1 Tax=Amycolatopsis rubida TaxID=112413 RepID=A0ABX0BPX1_9PSEU|nr:histidine kinase [Amycolatopsis sp. M39]MYW89934.1 sensor histidine kinase [Amycolatopsis rubida]NEC54911.1 sensor histidine kinase [Amycolatopsis rubida]OAP25092.1 Sensor histidine kinase LiaS [Amycolatopsis sp. M39]